MPRLEKDIVISKEKVMKYPAKNLREEYLKLGEAYHDLKDRVYCHECQTFLKRNKFYKSIHTGSGLIPTCKDCLGRIATGYDPITKQTNETRETIILALKKANLPFLEEVYEASCNAVTNENSDKKRHTTWSQMIVMLQSLPQYYGMTWDDSDHIRILDSKTLLTSTQTQVKNNTEAKDRMDEIIEQYKLNRKDVIHTIGYDPFENYPIENDKPVLYAQLNSFIDDETKNDGMKMGAVIQIVKKLNQAEKLNDQIDRYISDTEHAADNMSLIDKMASSSQKLMNVANSLAKDNGIDDLHQ